MRPDYYLKFPFVWQAGCPVPAAVSGLSFRPASTAWLEEALAEVLATSLDPADLLAVADYGAHGAATLMIDQAEAYSVRQPDLWQLAETPAGEPVGFVLCSVFAQKPGQTRGGSIYYMGILPAHRGHRYGRQLLDQATRALLGIGVQRILCDTAACNAPMIAAFRQAGYIESPPWERPLR